MHDDFIRTYNTYYVDNVIKSDSLLQRTRLLDTYLNTRNTGVFFCFTTIMILRVPIFLSIYLYNEYLLNTYLYSICFK